MGIERLNEVNTAAGETDDGLAEDEAKKFSGDAARNEARKQAMHDGVVVFIRVISTLFTIVLAYRISTLVLPDIVRLSPDRIQEIDRFMFSGVLGGAVTAYVKRCFSDDK